jgi:hypothetical protein
MCININKSIKESMAMGKTEFIIVAKPQVVMDFLEGDFKVLAMF